MKHTNHKRIFHLKRQYKHIAAAFVGAILMSSALLPGIPASIAHASMKSNVGNTRDAGTQKMGSEKQLEKKERKKDKKAGKGKLKNTIREHLKKGKPETSRNGKKQVEFKENESSNGPEQYEKVLDFTATAYSPGPLDNDQWGDKTHLGTTIRPGVVAVDPDLIPLGSRLYVKYPDGHGEYKVAEDTGGAIKGNRMDIAIMDRSKATDFGIQPVKVFIVSTPEKNKKSR